MNKGLSFMLRHLPLYPVLRLLALSTLCGIAGSLGTVALLAGIGNAAWRQAANG